MRLRLQPSHYQLVTFIQCEHSRTLRTVLHSPTAPKTYRDNIRVGAKRCSRLQMEAPMLSSLYRPAPCVFLSAAAAVMLPSSRVAAAETLACTPAAWQSEHCHRDFAVSFAFCSFRIVSLPCKAAPYVRQFMLEFQIQPTGGEFNPSLQPETQCALCLSQRPQQQPETETQMLAFTGHSHLVIRNMMLPRRR